MKSTINQSGFLSFFGFTNKNEPWLSSFFLEKLGISPNIITYKNKGSIFYFTNHGEIGATDNFVFLKLGFIWSSQENSVTNISNNTAREFDPISIQNGTISGNGYLIRFDKKEPHFAIFMTFMATTQLYYASWQGGIFFSNDLRVLLSVVERIEFNDKAIPLHYMFAMVPGPMTYFNDIYRIFPGEVLTWQENNLQIKYVKDIYITSDNLEYTHKCLDSKICINYFNQLSNIMNSYISEIERRGGKFSNELSGGVDSAIIQLLINDKISTDETQPTFSYKWDAASFNFEVGYAKEASALLKTKHTFLDIHNDDYATLLVNTIKTLAQPTICDDNNPGQLALAKYLASNYPELQYIFMGQGSDALHGIGFSTSVEKLNKYKNVPGYYAIRYFYYLFGTPIYRKKIRGLPYIFRILLMPDTYNRHHPPKNILDPVNQVCTSPLTLETNRRVFGNLVIKNALEYRYELTQKILKSHSILEQVHDIDTITEGYHSATVGETLFSSFGISLIPFYFDQELIRLVRGISPEVRFLRKAEVKPILKTILAQKSLGQIAYKKKGASGFAREFEDWITKGILKEMVHSIERPGFINKKDFSNLIEGKRPFAYEFIYRMLTYDIFKKNISSEYFGADRT